MPRREEYASFNLHKDILDLKAQLSEKESELLRMECSSLPPCSGPESTASTGSVTSEAEEWQAKYERLVDAHKRLQRNNICLEEKLLKIVDKFESDKNIISRDLATQTQKVVEAKLTIQQLHKLNTQLKSDLQVALNLLQMKPSSFVSQRLDSLPEDLQARVRQVGVDKEERRNQRNGGQRITIAMPSGCPGDEAVSAAILAKVLEERENERKKEQKFCIDIGTQTHGWHFPDTMDLLKQARARKLLSLQPDYSLLEQLSYITSEKDRKRLFDQRDYLDPHDETDYSDSEDEREDEEDGRREEEDVRGYGRDTHVSNILLASLIQSPPGHIAGQYPYDEDDWSNVHSKTKFPFKEPRQKRFVGCDEEGERRVCDQGDDRGVAFEDREVACDDRRVACDEGRMGRVIECDQGSRVGIGAVRGEMCDGGRKGRGVEKETNTCERDMEAHSEADSLVGVTSLKEDGVRSISPVEEEGTKPTALALVEEVYQPSSADLAVLTSAPQYCAVQQSTVQYSAMPGGGESFFVTPGNTPALSHQSSSLSSIFSLTQKASTPTITSNAFFKRSLSNTSWTYSAQETDM